MSTTFTKAGEDAERLAAMFSGLAGLADELKRVGSLQNAADEAERRIAESDAALSKRANYWAGQQADAEARLTETKSKIDGAQKAAEEIVNAAKREAEAVAVAAYADADKIAADVSARLAAEESNAQVRLSGLRDAAFALEARIRAGGETAQKAADELAASIAMKRQVDAEVARLKGLFGGAN